VNEQAARTNGELHVIARRHFLAGFTGVSTFALAPKWAALAQERSAKKIALVVGNQDYGKQGPLESLNTPLQDAEAVAAKFTKMGVKVTFLRDPTTAELRTAIGNFITLISEADIAIVYYAGHGIQATIGGSKAAQFFAPKDFRPPGNGTDAGVTPADFEAAARDGQIIGLSMLEEPIRRTRKIGLIFWDACRSNPFYDQPVALSAPARVVASADVGRLTRTAGPADKVVTVPPSVTEPKRFEIKRPEGIIVHYATRPGDVADDGAGAHSPYTAALLKHLDKPGITVSAMLNLVGTEVRQTTVGKQAPQVSGELYGGEIILVPQAAISTDSGRSNDRPTNNSKERAEPPQRVVGPSGNSGSGRPGGINCKEGPGCKTTITRPNGGVVTTTTSGFSD
jgi:uncharacterized caspase-like protein